MLAIEANEIVKTFGASRAVDGVDLAVQPGTVHGFLGPNGAGKTTTIRLLATLLSLDGGSARVFGHDVSTEPDAVRRRVSLTGQFASVDEDLTGAENLVLLGRLLGFSSAQARARAADLLGAFGLEEAAGRQVKTYSGGMRRRLDIAASIVVTPDLIFLDEPTTGLDPRSRNQVWDIVRALVAAGHHRPAHHAVPRRGRSARGPDLDHRPRQGHRRGHQCRAQGVGRIRRRCTCACVDPADRPEARAVLERSLGTEVQLESDRSRLTARVDDDRARIGAAMTEMSDAGIGVAEFVLGQPTMDEVFLALTGRPATEHDTVPEEAA